MGAKGGVLAIVLGSLIFYASWEPRFLLLLLPSVGMNYLAGHLIAARVRTGNDRSAGRRLIGAVTANLLVLGWYKYAGFFAASVNAAFGSHLPLLNALLPLGISFFTFEQIGYLVDVRRGAAVERNLSRYALFVMFFPRLVAGPILRFSELMPQVPQDGRMPHSGTDLAVGGTFFVMGLAKKTLFADGISPYATLVFADAAHGTPVGLIAAWGGTLAYTLQIYFDFSGYSDMAIGTARLFGLRFPMNFNSPYKSQSIIEFWRRWHMTLSRFLRDYLYVSLGGNRRGQIRRYVNLFATMLLGGLWHGANWTFVVWGALHGLYLIINHGWRALTRRVPQLAEASASPIGRMLCWSSTMLAVTASWVFFRAPDFTAARIMLAGMAGLHGVTATPMAECSVMWVWIVGLGAITLIAPNSQEILRDWRPVLESVGEPVGWPALRWRPSAGWGVAVAAAAMAGLLAISGSGEFLYWQF